jgi:DNA-binding NtrC family response regulator
MPLDAQAEVLRVLENREIKRIGATETLKVDVRVIASTNKNLEEEMKAGRFRADLFDRLNVFPIELPPLCERKEDIQVLLNHYLRIYCNEMNVKISGFSAEAQALLRHYAWPGNVRELKNAVERMVLEVGDREVIESNDLPQEIRCSAMNMEKYISRGKLRDAMGAIQREMITEALDRFNGNKSHAAKYLGLSRAGIEKMTRRLGLT